MILATHIRPFDAKQVVYILSDKYDVEESRVCDLSELKNTIMGILTDFHYNINKIELHGPEQFCLKEKTNIEKTTHYAKNKQNIEIVIKTD